MTHKFIVINIIINYFSKYVIFAIFIIIFIFLNYIFTYNVISIAINVTKILAIWLTTITITDQQNEK